MILQSKAFTSLITKRNFQLKFFLDFIEKNIFFYQFIEYLKGFCNFFF